MALLLPHHHPFLSSSKSHHFSFLISLSLSSPLSLSLWMRSTMATLQYMAFSCAASQRTHHPRAHPGVVSSPTYGNSSSAFYGRILRISRSQHVSLKPNTKKPSGLIVAMVKPTIQFIQGTDEQTIPDVRLTKSRDGTNGMAIFRLDQPSVFDSSRDVGDITGFYMIDEEGVLQSVDVSAKFVNGKPAGVEAKYIMRTPRDWDRFMRFMERYSNANGLQFVKN